VGTCGLDPSTAQGRITAATRDEMTEQELELGGAPEVATRSGRFNVVPYNRLNGLATIRAMDQIAAELHGDDLGKMLVYGNGIDLVGQEIAKGDAVLQTQHGRPPLFAA
jgi:hypothetical protein